MMSRKECTGKTANIESQNTFVCERAERASDFGSFFGAASFRNPLVRAWCGPGAALVLQHQNSAGQARAILARAIHELKIVRLSAGLARMHQRVTEKPTS